MRAGGDFRHHAAECRMLADLRENHVGQNTAVTLRIPLHHGGGGFVASRFDAENDHRCIYGSDQFGARSCGPEIHSREIAGAAAPVCSLVRVTASPAFEKWRTLV